MALKVSSKDIVEHFYKPHSTVDTKWVCSCGHERAQTGTGYTNLLDHVKRKHDNYEELVLAAKESVGLASVFKRTVVKSKARDMHGWLELVVGGLEPFSFVEKPYVQKHMKLSPTTTETFGKYMRLLTAAVQKKIETLLPDRFVLVFDGWSLGSRYLVAVFASYPHDNANGYEKLLLSFTTFENETTHNADEHQRYMQHVLSEYNKTLSSVVALVGDNASVNTSLADKLCLPFVGCASHRLNLAIKDKIKEQKHLFDKIQRLMVKLKYGLLAAHLRKLTPYCALLMNETRWSSAYQMMKRYVLLRSFIASLDDAVVDALLPSPGEERQIDAVLRDMKNLEGIQVDLQTDEMTLLDVRDSFDEVLDKFPQMRDRLKEDARIVHNPTFEAAVCRIQAGREDDLNDEQRAAVAHLRKPASAGESSVAGEEEALRERARKRRKMREMRTFERYIDTRFILPTSNLCERLFSVAKNAVGERRQCLRTESLEAQIFLRCNMHLWNVFDVNALM